MEPPRHGATKRNEQDVVSRGKKKEEEETNLLFNGSSAEGHISTGTRQCRNDIRCRMERSVGSAAHAVSDGG